MTTRRGFLARLAALVGAGHFMNFEKKHEVVTAPPVTVPPIHTSGYIQSATSTSAPLRYGTLTTTHTADGAWLYVNGHGQAVGGGVQ